MSSSLCSLTTLVSTNQSRVFLATVDCLSVSSVVAASSCTVDTLASSVVEDLEIPGAKGKSVRKRRRGK